MTAADLKAMLRRHHAPVRAIPKWVYMEEIRRNVSYDAGRTLDAMAICVWSSKKHAIHGYEIKVSRKDFKRELADPDKAGVFYQWVDRFYLVTPPGLVKPEELPTHWGLLEASPTGRFLLTKKQARTIGQSVIGIEERERLVCMLRGAVRC